MILVQSIFYQFWSKGVQPVMRMLTKSHDLQCECKKHPRPLPTYVKNGW